MVDQWCRKALNGALERIVSSSTSSESSVLEISGDSWRDHGFGSYRSVEYPEFDICVDRLRERFDLIIAEQVFEHIRHPSWAARNVYRMLKPGGKFVISTPFLVRYHPLPTDYWRWTKPGLACFLEDAGFVDVHSDAWGNRDVVIANLDEWVDFDEAAHQLDNDPDLPIQVWAVGARPGRRQALRQLIRPDGTA